MKSLHFGRFVAASCVFSLPAMAVPLYWDGTGSTWGTASNWSTDPAAAVPDPVAAPGSTDTATFSTTSVTTAQTIGLGGNQSALGLVFNNQSNVTLNGGGTNSVLSLGTDGIIATGTTTSGGAPTRVYTIGNTTAGQNLSISLLGSQSWLSNLSGASVNSGDGIYVRNGVSLGVTGTHTLTLSGTSGTTPLNTISGIISDGGADRTLNININGPSVRWTLSGNNTYTGTTTVTSGALTLATSVNALGSTSAGTTVLSGAGLFFRGNVGSMAAESLTITGNGPDAKGALRNVGGTTNVWNGTIAATTATGTSATI
jgi:fibronectin-binding autotransporter adhesin